MLHIETVKLRWQLTGMELVREALKRAKQRGMTYKIILMITRNFKKKIKLNYYRNLYSQCQSMNLRPKYSIRTKPL